jgi:SAM-dependent methyltransferase
MTPTAIEVKACCAASYAGPAARYLLGDCFHPGGMALTSELLGELRVSTGATVLDVGSGPGTSAILAAQQLGCRVVGVELSADNVIAATRAASLADVAGRVLFIEGDAEALPLEAGSMDGVLSECSFCLFPDKRTAASEFARVLRPGARLALSDVTADPTRLPVELTGLGAWVACIADARPLDNVVAVLEGAGFEVEKAGRRDRLLADIVNRVEARLRLARVIGASLGEGLEASIERGVELIPAVRAAIAEGALGYGVVVARR